MTSVVEVDAGVDADPVTLSDIAARLGRTRSLVGSWFDRGQMPPAAWPATAGVRAQNLWNWPDVQAWLQSTGRLDPGHAMVETRSRARGARGVRTPEGVPLRALDDGQLQAELVAAVGRGDRRAVDTIRRIYTQRGLPEPEGIDRPHNPDTPPLQMDQVLDALAALGAVGRTDAVDKWAVQSWLHDRGHLDGHVPRSRTQAVDAWLRRAVDRNLVKVRTIGGPEGGNRYWLRSIRPPGQIDPPGRIGG
jgi:hypothetical protein